MSARAAIFGCAGPVLAADEVAFFRDSAPWGFILFARNVETPGQLRRLTDDLRTAVGRDAPVLVDQEGGRVQRLRAPLWREWAPPLQELSALPVEHAARLMFLRGRLIADELRVCGIDVNCAPLGDLARDDTHPVLRNRCYGGDPARVAVIARAMADGLLAGGALPVLKHLPGHGGARVDSHMDLPRVSDAMEELRARDFAVFQALADLPLGMSAHVVFDAVDPDHPATQSPAMIRAIRDDIGFGGLLMTDDLAMQALSGSMGQRARAALDAGIDVILHCNGGRAEMEAVAAEVPVLAGLAAERAEAALALRRVPEAFGAEAALAEHAALRAAAGGVHV